MSSLTRTALAVGAFLAVAAPAAANPADDPSIKMRIPDIPIAAGVIEHGTVETCYTSHGRVAEMTPSDCITYEVYAAQDRDRETATSRSGRVSGERATVEGTIFSWTSKDNAIVVGKSKRRSSSISFAADDAMWKDTVARGWYAAAGEEVRGGRPVIKYVETALAPNVEGTDTLYLDKETGALVERTLDSRFQSMVTKVLGRETLPRTAANEKLLVMGDHAGAAVREVQGEDATIARAAKKAGLKAKSRAKIRKALRKARR